MKKLAYAIMYAYSLLLAGALAYFASDLLIRPVTIVDLTLLTPQLSASSGYVLKYHATYIRHKLCKSSLDRFVTEDHDGLSEHYSILFREEIPSMPFLGSYMVDNQVKLPVLPLGTYSYRQYLISWCSFVTRVDAYPVRNFKVVP